MFLFNTPSLTYLAILVIVILVIKRITKINTENRIRRYWGITKKRSYWKSK